MLDNTCRDCGAFIHRRSIRCMSCHLVRARAARSYAPRDRASATCPLCGVEFKPLRRSVGGFTRCCSRSCARKLAIRDGSHPFLDGKQVGRDPERRRASNGAASRKRRAALLGVESDPYTVDSLAERDEFICHLCGGEVDMRLHWPDRRSPSVDHVVPLSRGGDDTLANVKLAHLTCNLSKGNRVEEVCDGGEKAESCVR